MKVSLRTLGLWVAAPAVLALAGQGCHRGATQASSSQGPLKVEMGKSARLDPDAALRCFVHGQFVGMQTPAECAGKNGVAPGALDVGLDQSGALAAGAGDTPLQPLSNAVDNTTDDDGKLADAGPSVATDTTSPPSDDAGAGQIGQVSDCLRFGRSGWVDAGRGVTLNACVRTVFDGRCVGPGQAMFARWGSQTLRLVPGRVGVSADNRNFHPLMAQDPSNCSISG